MGGRHCLVLTLSFSSLSYRRQETEEINKEMAAQIGKEKESHKCYY